MKPIASVNVIPGSDLHGIVPDGEYVLVKKDTHESLVNVLREIVQDELCYCEGEPLCAIRKAAKILKELDA